MSLERRKVFVRAEGMSRRNKKNGENGFARAEGMSRRNEKNGENGFARAEKGAIMEEIRAFGEKLTVHRQSRDLFIECR